MSHTVWCCHCQCLPYPPRNSRTLRCVHPVRVVQTGARRPPSTARMCTQHTESWNLSLSRPCPAHKRCISFHRSWRTCRSGRFCMECLDFHQHRLCQGRMTRTPTTRCPRTGQLSMLRSCLHPDLQPQPRSDLRCSCRTHRSVPRGSCTVHADMQHTEWPNSSHCRSGQAHIGRTQLMQCLRSFHWRTRCTECLRPSPHQL
eukprot:COSAG02_NODE_20831_length_814_cov_0.847552_2_plen_200_part_01